MREVTVNVYKFDELSDEAKQKAIAWFRGGQFDGEWWDSVFEDAATCLAFLGFDILHTEMYINHKREHKCRVVPYIRFTGFSSQGDGACFEGDWAASKVDMAGLKDHAPQDKTLEKICAELSVIALRYPDLTISIHMDTSHYCNSGTMATESVDFHMADEGAEDEIGWSDAMRHAERGVQQCARAAADWIYKQLEAENDYLSSDEACIEGIEANEYEFTEDGERA